MTQPNQLDDNAIGGTHPGTTTQAEMESQVSLRIDNSKSLQDVANQIIASADWHLNSFSDTNRSPKYAVDPSVSYYGSGSLSLLSRLGKLAFSSNVNEANRGAFSLDHGDSSFYSSLNSTTLGSLKIDTVDGYELNPLSPVFPSTNFSPTKPWVKKLFPTLSARTLVTVAILELVQYQLLRLANDAVGPQGSENFESKKDGNDIATIIVDNQEIEDQLFAQR